MLISMERTDSSPPFGLADHHKLADRNSGRLADRIQYFRGLTLQIGASCRYREPGLVLQGDGLAITPLTAELPDHLDA